LKILVTGSTGFIGNHVVMWLIAHGYDVIATGTSVEKAKTFSWFDKVTFIPCDYFNQYINYYTFFGCPDILIHLAWKGLPNYMELFHIEQNLPIEMRFIRSFAESQKTKIIVVGTCYEYGKVNGCISENQLTNPNTSYGLAKDTLRKHLTFLNVEYNFSWNWIRLFYMYGEGQNPKSLLSQLNTAIINGDAEFPMSGGEQLRDYLSVEKVAEYICKITFSNYNGIVNCCSGNPISVKKLVEEYILANKSSIKLKTGVYDYSIYEGMAFWGDNTKLNEITGYNKCSNLYIL